MNTHTRILTRLINTPLAISQDKLDILTTEISFKLLAGLPLASGVANSTDKPIQTQERVSVVKVFDSLVAKGGAGESGFTSYEGLKSRIQSAIDSGASKIVLYIDSPGGEVAGLFGLTSFIASIPSTYGVETVAFTDGYMTSAAYAIGSAAQTIYSTESSNIGSIGVIMSLVDVTKADEKNGYNYTILRSKDLKAVYNPHETLSDTTIEKYSTILSELDGLFNAEVARNRPSLTLEAINGFKADSFLGAKALELGLIDGLVSSIDEVVGNSTPNKSKLTSTTGANMTLDEMKAKLSAAETEIASLKAAAISSASEAVKAERARCLDILTAGSTLKISSEQVNKRIAAGTSKDDTLDVFTAIADALGTSSHIDTTTDLQATVDKTTVDAGLKFQFGEATVSASDILAAAKGDK